MARSFNGSNQYLQSVWPPFTEQPVTMACWFKPANVTSYGTLLFLGNSEANSTYYAIDCRGDLSGDPLSFFVRDSNSTRADTTTGLSTGVWQHACAVSSGATSHSVYLNGSSKGTASGNSAPDITNRVSIGRSGDSSPGGYFNGAIAEAAIWSAALSDEEAALLAKGVSPLLIRPANLIFYTPLIRDNDRDLIEGLTMTPANSPTVDDHPRIIYPSAQILSFEAAAAGGGTTVNPTLLKRRSMQHMLVR